MIARFGSREIDFDRVEIRSGADQIAVEPQVFDVLSYLIEHRDRLVTKEELLDNVWGDRFVSESALTSRIKSARQAIGDSGREQSMIKTIHGRGYRFVADVEMVATAGAPAGGAPADSTARAFTATSTGSVDAPELDTRWPLVGRHDELEHLERAYAEQHVAGVLLTGPPGIGKTRLARECLVRASAAGRPTMQVSGHVQSEHIPLAAVAHLLPPDVLDAGTEAGGDLARAVVFRRARTAFAAHDGGDRPVMMVDNVDHLDEMTSALIGSLMSTDDVFVVMTQRTSPGDPLTLDELVRSGQVAHIELDPLDDNDLDVLLYRVLSGPIDLQSLEYLTGLARGRPGALQQLVETCRATGALDQQGGVWRLVGPVHPTVGHPGGEQTRIDELDGAVNAGAEVLAIAEHLDLGFASELLGVDVLDELDAAGLLALTESSFGTRVSLAHPHTALILLEGLGPLRARRHKARLVEALDQHERELPPDDRLRLVRWKIETGATPERDEVMASLRFAVSIADATNADVLLDHLDRVAPGADASQQRAELTFRLGQTDTAERLLGELPVDELEATVAASVVRRRATIMFHVRGRYREALALLMDGVDGPSGELLAAHAAGLQGFLGYADEIDALAAAMPDDLGLAPRLEMLRGRAQAAVAQGRYDQAIALVADHRRESLSLDPGAAQAGTETAVAIHADALTERGEVGQVIELLRTHLPSGQRTMLAWLPLAAARTHLAIGHARAARGLIMTPLAAVRSQNLLHAEPLMTGVLAQATAQIGDEDAARAQLHLSERMLDELMGSLQWTLAGSIADAWITLGDRDRARSVAVSLVDDALSHGADARAAELLLLAAIAGDRDASSRLPGLATDFDGTLWPLKIRHARALERAAGADEFLEIARDYGRLGYERLANLTLAAANHD